MQYILSEEEYTALKQEQMLTFRLKSEALADLCTRIADTLPITLHWAKDEPPAPWGCIVTAEHEHYCDECPVIDICPRMKHLSK